MKRATVSADGETITVHIPMTFRKRGGRKLVVTPDGAEWAPRPRVDNAMVKALARAFRWRKQLDTGMHASLEDLARAKGVAPSYVSRVLRLTLLAPEIVEAILDGRQPAELRLDDLLEGFPLEWEEQRWPEGRSGGGDMLPQDRTDRSNTTTTIFSGEPSTFVGGHIRFEKFHARLWQAYQPYRMRSNFHYERAEWVFFRSATTLPQKAGVPVGQLRRLVLKELVDNALDAGARVRVGHLEGKPDGFFVEDDGIGIDPQQVGRLFSINRPMISSKLRRLPTRGALGNGLRVVTGAVAASTGGSLRVLTRNRLLDLTPREDGGTDVEETAIDYPRGTRIEIVFGPELPVDPNATAWALAALRLSPGERYAGKSSPFWYDPDAFFELLNAAGDRPVRSLVAELDGCTGGKAGTIAAAFKGRSCASLSRAEAGALLDAARDLARPVRPERLGAVGPIIEAMPHHAYAIERGTFRAGAREPLAVIPFVVEAWVSFGGNRNSTAAHIAVHVNRSPATGNVQLWREKAALCLYGCGLGREFSLPKGEIDVAINVLTPHCPITSDGKAPDLGSFEDAIVAAIQRAGRKAISGSRAPDRVSAKTAVLEHLDAAVEKASGGGRYRFNQRQVFYVLRPLVRRSRRRGAELRQLRKHHRRLRARAWRRARHVPGSPGLALSSAPRSGRSRSARLPSRTTSGRRGRSTSSSTSRRKASSRRSRRRAGRSATTAPC